jgi:hypothetical protein
MLGIQTAEALIFECEIYNEEGHTVDPGLQRLVTTYTARLGHAVINKLTSPAGNT